MWKIRINVITIFTICLIVIVIYYILYSSSLSYNNVKFKKSHERILNIDRRNVSSEEIFVENIAKDIPYLPIEDLINSKYEKRNLNSSCAWYPSLHDVKIHNDYWQEFKNGNITFYIFGAYYDNRPGITPEQPVVRVLAMLDFIANKNEEYPVTYCHLWYDNMTQPIITPMKETLKIWVYSWRGKKDRNYAHFITCPVSLEYKDMIPKTISLVEQPCDKATNNVRVTYLPLTTNETRKEFAVCIKGLDYPYKDISHRLVEYIETLRILGAEKIVMYRLQIHANSSKVLEYYQNTGFLDYRPLSLTTAISNLEDYRHLEMHKNKRLKTLHEPIPYNDCLYRNMYRYKYIAVIDTDELLMPLGNITNWHDLLSLAQTFTNEKCKSYASYCFRCIYFPRYPEKPRYSNDIPEYFYMLQHVERVQEHLRPTMATKCLHSTDRVIATHNHFPMHWQSDLCRSYSFDPEIAQMQHYREPDIKKTLEEPVIDLSLWRMKDEIMNRSIEVLEKLNFFNNYD